MGMLWLYPAWPGFHLD